MWLPISACVSCKQLVSLRLELKHWNDGAGYRSHNLTITITCLKNHLNVCKKKPPKNSSLLWGYETLKSSVFYLYLLALFCILFCDCLWNCKALWSTVVGFKCAPKINLPLHWYWCFGLLLWITYEFLLLFWNASAHSSVFIIAMERCWQY